MAQLAPPLGGRGKKFCGNLPRNLRAELPQMERDKLVAEWERLVGRGNKPVQLGQVSTGGRGNKSGESEAARQLGLSRQDVRRAIKVASITPEAQQAAHEVGNRWATKSKQLLAFASRWVQLVGIWWASGGEAFILPGKLFHAKSNSTIIYFCSTQKK